MCARVRVCAYSCLRYTSTSEYTYRLYCMAILSREYKRGKECARMHLYPVSGKYDVFGLKSAVLISAEGSG